MNIHDTLILNTERKIPIIGLGTWKLTHQTAETIDKAIALGYPMIDTSSDYGTQPGVGEGLKKNNVNREDIYIVTKVEETDNAYERTLSNLKELQTDYIDLELIHRPPKDGAGVELWKSLIKAREEGLVKDIGVSNYSAAQIDELITATDVTPAVNQIEWSPFGHSMEMKKYADERGMLVMAYSPLTRTERLDNDTLETIAQSHDKSPAQIMIRWNLQLGTIPIPKANELNDLEENINVFDFELSQDDMNDLNQLNEHYSALGSLPYL